ncbi:Dihydropteroate synthase-like protein [Catenaria anguillulae PL171]|uniref:Folic acid synthesis protein FOL1 n=1 Tax=Catenaria anguillulae PL171 TaxID=765915 RepID=A0A1Y2HS59_9FUNG|nr:Dihydropteroate synthase-like protein [Catenaria anguillulae PL171]
MSAADNNSSSVLPLDTVSVTDLLLRNQVGLDNWERARPQPLRISVHVQAPTQHAGARDLLLPEAINYGDLSRLIALHADDADPAAAAKADATNPPVKKFKSMEALAVHLTAAILTKFKAAHSVAVHIEKPRALLHAECAGVRVSRDRSSLTAVSPPPATIQDDAIYIRSLSVSTIIGIHPWERDEKQLVHVHLDLYPPNPLSANDDRVPKAYNYRRIANAVQAQVESSAYKTVEALCHHLARFLLERIHVHKCTVQVSKPSALVFAKTAGVKVTRDQVWLASLLREEMNRTPPLIEPVLGSGETDNDPFLPSRLSTIPRPLLTPPVDPSFNLAYLALGTNLGDRAANIHRALRLLTTHPTARVIMADTSFLYETPPMYVTDQPAFLNAACKIYTPLAPLALLDVLKEIEAQMGRDLSGNALRNGPRPIDLDILMYFTKGATHQVEISSDRLELPHQRMGEREFVLRPLADIAADVDHPTHFRTISKLLALLVHKHQSADPTYVPIHRVLPFPLASPAAPPTTWHWAKQTYVMGILNITPDSFSDGGDLFDSTAVAVAAAQRMVAQGAHLLDIGGQSTRPGANQIGAQAELARVLPVIQAIRAAGILTPLSIDTYHASVARAAVLAGCSLVNDVTGGLGDPDMLRVVAELQVPYCAMHMRGDPQTMASLTKYDEGVVPGVARELHARVKAALSAGVHRWNVIVDPGIGFAKNAGQNFVLVSQLGYVCELAFGQGGFPVLVGPSRKRFIGEATGKVANAKERGWGTAAAVAACVAGGADVVRVHDVAEMADVVRVSDRVWREQVAE